MSVSIFIIAEITKRKCKKRGRDYIYIHKREYQRWREHVNRGDEVKKQGITHMEEEEEEEEEEEGRTA